MCPACMTTAALVLTGSVSAGGLAGLFGKYVYRKRRTGTQAIERPAQDPPTAALHKSVTPLKSSKTGI